MSFTSVEGLKNLSSKLQSAVSSLQQVVATLEEDADKINKAYDKLVDYDGCRTPEKEYERTVFETETYKVVNYYCQRWAVYVDPAASNAAYDAKQEITELVKDLDEQFKKVAKQVANVAIQVHGNETKALDVLLGNIAYNKYDAKGNNFIEKDKILKQYWTDGKLEFFDEYNGKPLGNGVKIILKNGVPMGFTTTAAYNQYMKAKRETISSDDTSKSQEHERVVSGGHKPVNASSNKSIETDANAQNKVKNVSKGINTAAGERHHASNNSSRGNAYQKTTTAPSSSKINPTPADPKNYKTVPEYAKANNDSISVKLDKNGGWAGDNGQGVYRKIGEFKKSTFARDIKLADGRKLESDTYFTHNGTMHWVFKDKKTGDSYVSQPGINNYSKIVKTGEYDHNM